MNVMLYLEYKSVAAKTRQSELMLKAHTEPCSKEDAIDLIRKLSEIYDIKVPTIKFHAESKGCCYCKRNHIILPSNIYDVNAKRISNKRLRTGIVLHEFAHLLAHKRGSKKPHGNLFIETFDELLINYFIVP